jgi:hypothetical protein
MNYFRLVRRCPVPPTAIVVTCELGWGEVEVGGVVFHSSVLLDLRNELDFAARVEVAVVPDDLSRAWVFDPINQQWFEVTARKTAGRSRMI